MKKLTTLLLVLLFIISPLYSQIKYNPLPEHVSQAKSLKEKYPDENIVISEKNSQVNFVYKSGSKKLSIEVTEITRFMNISTSSSFQHAIIYDSESVIKSFKVNNRKGQELLVAQGDEHLKVKDFFHADYRVKYVNLTMPLQGYILEVETVKKYDDFKYFTSTYFSDRYPVVKNTLKINTPKDLKIDFIEFNFNDHNFSKAEDASRNTVTTTYTFENLGPNTDESNAPGSSYLYPHIMYIPRSYGESGDVTFFNSTEDLYKWYIGLVNDVEIDSSVYKGEVENLIKGKLSDAEKISSIFYWVQDNIRYVAFEDGIAGFKPDSPQNVYNKRYGDCKGMAILTKHMLLEAGYDARLVWIGTDKLAYDYSTPSLAVDNHMICSVFIDNEYVFLDGTEKFNKYGDYAGRIQNKQALIQTASGFEVVKVPQAKENVNVETQNYNLELLGEKLFGNASKSFLGESRVSFQNSLLQFGNDDQEDVLKNYLTGSDRNIAIDNIDVKNLRSRENNLSLDYDIEINEVVSSFDDAYYLDLTFMGTYEGYVFNEREVDFKLHHRENNKTALNLTLPEGAILKNLPKDFEISNELMDVSVSFSKNGNILRVEENVNFKQNLIKESSFPEWNAALEKLGATMTQQLEIVY